MKKIKIRIFAVHAKIWERAQYGASLPFAVLRSRKTGVRTEAGNPVRLRTYAAHKCRTARVSGAREYCLEPHLVRAVTTFDCQLQLHPLLSGKNL